MLSSFKLVINQIFTKAIIVEYQLSIVNSYLKPNYNLCIEFTSQFRAIKIAAGYSKV